MAEYLIWAVLKHCWCSSSHVNWAFLLVIFCKMADFLEIWEWSQNCSAWCKVSWWDIYTWKDKQNSDPPLFWLNSAPYIIPQKLMCLSRLTLFRIEHQAGSWNCLHYLLNYYCMLCVFFSFYSNMVLDQHLCEQILVSIQSIVYFEKI